MPAVTASNCLMVRRALSASGGKHYAVANLSGGTISVAVGMPVLLPLPLHRLHGWQLWRGRRLHLACTMGRGKQDLSIRPSALDLLIAK